MVYRVTGRLVGPCGCSCWDQSKWGRKDEVSGHLSLSRRGRASEEREQNEQSHRRDVREEERERNE